MGRGLGKVKEEVTANGRRRGTFAQTPAHPGGALQFAETSDEDALRNPDARQKSAGVKSFAQITQGLKPYMGQ